MSTHLLPSVIQQILIAVLFTLSALMVAVHSVLFIRAAPRTAGSRMLQPEQMAVITFLASWLGIAILMTSDPGLRLASDEQRLLSCMLVAFGPFLLAVSALFLSKDIRSVYTAMPPEWLIQVQIYRIAGLLFLYPFLYYGTIPTSFAIPTAVGDFLTGFFALIVGSAIARRRPGAFAWAVVWNLFGIADLIVAPITATLSGAQVLRMDPLAIVPLFLGTPLGILTHIYSLQNLTATRSQTATDVSTKQDQTRFPEGFAPTLLPYGNVPPES